MPVPTLAEARLDLRVTGTAQDAKIQRLLNAAIRSASEYLNRPIPWTDDAGNPVEVPETVYAAIMLELRALFDDPESVHSLAFKNLLGPSRTNMGV